MAGFLQNLVKVAQQRASQVYDQVNPLDGGRTYQQRTPVAPQASVPYQMTHNTATNAVGNNLVKPVQHFAAPLVNTALGLGNAAYHIGTLPIETARTATAELTNNRAATNAGIQRGMQGINAIKGLAQGTTSMAYQLGESFNPAGGNVYNRQHTFTDPVGKVVFGSAPIPSMQKQYKDTKAQKGAAYGAGEALTTALMDAAGVKGAAEAPVLKPAIAKTVKEGKANYASGKAKLAMNDDLSQQIAQHTTAIKSLKERQAQTPIGSTASENHQLAIDKRQAIVNNLKAQKQKLTIPEKLMNQQVGNTVGGPNALQYMQAKKAGRVFEGVDGKPRFEIDDSKARIVNPEGKTLGEVMDHPGLYENYPQLKNTPILRDNSIEGAAFNPDNGKITLGQGATAHDIGVLLHENQHNIQDIEGFAPGGSPFANPAKLNEHPEMQRIKQQMQALDNQLDTASPEQRRLIYDAQDELTRQKNELINNHEYQNYQNLGGEAEARAVEARANLTDKQRYVKSEPSYKSLDKQAIHKQPNLSNKQLDSLSPEAIDALKQQGFKGVSNGKRTVRFDEDKNSQQAGSVETLGAAGSGDTPTLYHGTDQTFDKFDIEKHGTRNPKDKGEYGKGIYLTPDRNVATKYGKNIKEVKANLEKPFTIDSNNREANIAAKNKLIEIINKTTGSKIEPDFHGSGQQVSDFIYDYGPDKVSEILKKNGYDGVVVNNKDYPEVVVFDTKKLSAPSKSQPATSLRSTFYDSLDVPKEDLIIKHDGGTVQDIKQAQLEAIKRLNPMTDDYHTGIRSVDDIKTYKEAFDDPESFVYPDFSKQQAAQALKDGKITIYSSYPLDSNKAQFVTPSRMQAKDYAGNGQVHSKVVSLDEVAWINGDEGNLVGKVTGNNGPAMSTATLTLRKQMVKLAKQAGNEKDPIKKEQLYQQVDKLMQTIGNADFEEATRRVGPMMSIEKPSSGKGTPKEVSSGEAKPKPALPAKEKGAVSSTQLKRSELTGKALSTPTSKMGSAEYAKAFGVSKEQAAKELAKANETAKARPIPKQKPKPLTAAENTAKNPTKVTLPKVEEGNYEQARLNPQIASHPVNYATGQALDAIKAAGIKDTSTFGKMVEGDLKPRNAKEAAAVQAYKDLSNRVHATSQALGGNTPYVENYFRHEWDLSNPEDAARFDKLATKSKNVDPYAFEGLDRQPRVFTSIKQGEAAGFKLANPDLKNEVANYGSGSAHALKQQALAKALTEADMGEANKPHTFDLGGGKNVLLSDKGMKEAKGYAKSLPSDSKALQAYRKGNRGFKQMLLSVSQFHPINISALRAAPTLVAEGHPLKGAKGLFDTFAAQADKGYSTKLQTTAMRDGTLEASARLGTPIKFGSDYSSESKVGFGNGGLGEKAIFERAMPAMHIQMVKAAIQDLKDEGLSLDSKEAHALGTRINEIMGFVNTEARNLDKGTQRRLGDIFLAPQFTRAKWATNKGAVTQGGLAGSYARRSIVANSVASAVVAMGVGYALSQKSDSIGDILMRSVFHPSVPTPLKDKKGNTMELGLPATQSSEVLGLLGFSMKRGSNGHLQVAWKGGNIPGNVANYGRSRLAVLPATGLKVATNTDYAGKPLYDPAADTKTKVEQGATTIGSGLLPIGGQGIVQTNAVKSRLPQGVQQVLDANTPGSNPVLKSIGSAFGLTPKTDKTTGKGLQTTQYFDALDAAKKGLNPNDLAAYNAIHPQSKNPVSGTYQTTPTIYDSQNKATTYLKDPNVLAADNKLNQALKSQGQAIDPFFNLSPDQQNIALNYQALAQGDMRRSNFLKAYPFLNQLSADRNSFFSALPAGNATDTNGNSKAQLPSNLQYPNLTAAEQTLTDKYYNTTSPTVKKQLLQDPAMAAAVGKVKDYSANIASTRRVPQATDLPGYTPPVPKNPIPSANSGNSTKTTYDPTTQTWTQVSSKTGRTTVISADGTRTVVNAGTRTSTSRKTGTGSRGGKAKLITFPKATSMKSLNSKVASAKVKKLSLSGTIGRSKMRSYKQPTLRLRKKLA